MNTKELKKIVDSAFKLNKGKVAKDILKYIQFSNKKAAFTNNELTVQYNTPDIVGKFTFDRTDLRNMCIIYPKSDFYFTEEGAMIGDKLIKLRSSNDEFPIIPTLPNSSEVLTKYDQLKLKNLLPFIGKEGYVKQSMTCIYIDRGVGVATDSHIMRWEELQIGSSGFIHPSFFTFMTNEDYYINFISDGDDDWCHIYNDSLSISWRQIRDKFPNWQAVIPKYENPIKLLFDKNSLVVWLKEVNLRAKVFRPKITLIKVTPSLLIYENEEGDVEITHEVNLPKDTPPFKLSVTHLLPLLSVIDNDEIVMLIDSVYKPILINKNSMIMPGYTR